MSVSLRHVAVLVLAAASILGGSDALPRTGEHEAAVAICPYCRADRVDDEFCHRCGRLVWSSTAPGAGRFWGDAGYVIPFPSIDAVPDIKAEISNDGLVRETVAFPSGDRFTLIMKKGVARVEGHVGLGGSTHESDMEATIHDTLNEGRLAIREVIGSVSDKSLYRKLEYEYDAEGRLSSIKFANSVYAGSSDYKKQPAAWQRHARGEIVIRREAGRLARIETTVRVGRRSLRGEPEYDAPTVIVDEIVRGADGSLERIVRSTEGKR